MNNSADIRKENKRAIYRFMLDGRLYTKQQVAKGTGLSAATCNTLLNDLTAQGIVTGGSKQSGEVGRSSVLYQINEEHECYLAIHFYVVKGQRWLESIVFSATGRILSKTTRPYDLVGYEQVEAAIEEFEGVLLFVSHDRYFIEKFAERIWLLEDGGIRDFACGYKKYRSILEHEAAAKPAVIEAPKPKKEKPKGGTKETDKLIRRLEREIEKQEKAIEELDVKIEAASADYQELTRLLGEKEEAEMVLMDLMEQWESAQE